ncbi:MAG TPA: BBP7 family outer membrane beta-barrel protein, partial [Gemmataceae bacterium]
DVVWRAARAPGQRPAAAPQPAPAPAAVAVAPVAATGPVWVRARGQAPDEVLPSPKGNPPAVGQLPPSVNGPVFAQPVPQMIGSDGVVMSGDPMPAAQASGRAPRLEVSAEFLVWWTKGAQVPPLLTTSPPLGANGLPGTLPGATVLLGGGDLDDSTRYGGRFGLVYWLDDCASYGFDSRYFFTGERTSRFAINSRLPDGSDLALFRPFFAPNTLVAPPVVLPGPFVEQVTGPGVSTGTFSAEQKSRFWGAETNYRDNIWCRQDCNGGVRADLLAGFRYLNLDEALTITEDYTLLTTDAVGNPPGTHVVITDRFATENEFYGGQLGTVIQARRGRWTADLRTTVALGWTHERSTIEGGQVRTPPGGAPELFLGGLLALDSNIGRRSRDVFSVVPEVGLNLGYQVTDSLRAFVGYNFLYWSNVIRPGDQIDTVIDVTRVPAFVRPGTAVAPVFPPRPAARFNESDFWAQGINVGMEYRW